MRNDESKKKKKNPHTHTPSPHIYTSTYAERLSACDFVNALHDMKKEWDRAEEEGEKHIESIIHKVLFHIDFNFFDPSMRAD